MTVATAEGVAAVAAKPGQSNDKNATRRALENALIRELRMRRQTREMGLPSGNDQKIKTLKKRLGHPG